AAPRWVQLLARDPVGARLPVLAGEPRGGAERHAAAALCRGHRTRDHSGDLRVCLDRRRPGGCAVRRRPTRPRLDLLATYPRAADRTCGALAAAGRLAPVEAPRCLISTWR